MADEIFVGDVGTALRLRVTENGEAVDVSLVGAKQIKLRTPDGRVVTKTAQFTDDGTDGYIEYVTIAGDLDVPGKWRIQGFLTNLGGWTGHTSEGRPFHVKAIVG